MTGAHVVQEVPLMGGEDAVSAHRSISRDRVAAGCVLKPSCSMVMITAFGGAECSIEHYVGGQKPAKSGAIRACAVWDPGFTVKIWST
jgi:hypothetical protein